MNKTLIFVLILFLNYPAYSQIIKLDTADPNELEYSCTHLDLGLGETPRIRLDYDRKTIKIEYSNFQKVDVFMFQDSFYRYVDTLDEPAPTTELFLIDDLKPINWTEISSLKSIGKIDDSCIEQHDFSYDLMLKQAFKVRDINGFIIVATRGLDDGKAKKEIPYYYEPYLFNDGQCEYIELCRGNFWNGLEKILVTDIIFNGFPVVLAIESKRQFGEGKGLRMIFNRMEK